MKNKLIFVGILAVVLVFGFMVTGCPTDSDLSDGGGQMSKFEGTWKRTSSGEVEVFVFKNNTFTDTVTEGEDDFTWAGSFTYDETVITFTPTSSPDDDLTPWTKYYKHSDDGTQLALNDNTAEFTITDENAYIKQ